MTESTHICDECESEFESEMPHKLCPSCAEERAMAALSNVSAPEGGWRRGSQMSQL